MTGPTLDLGDNHAAVLRSIDLGDDAAELARCEALMAKDELTPYGISYLGVLRYRAKRWADAVTALIRAAEDGEDQEQRNDALLLAAYAELRAGSGEAALAIIERATQARAAARGGVEDEETEDEEDEGAWKLHHARGDALFVLGRHAEAEAEYTAALATDQHTVTQVELGLLKSARGDVAGAVAVLEASFEDHREAEAVYELAALKIGLGEPGRALELFREHAKGEALATRALKDPRFAGVLNDPEFSAFASPPPPDLGWLQRFPIVAALSAEARLAEVGVRFVSEEESAKSTESARKPEVSLGVLWTDGLLEDTRQRAERCVLVARGPKIPSRQEIVVHEIELWADLEQPERLFVAADFSIPAAFWLPLSATVDGVCAAIAEFHPPVRRTKLELPRVERALMGYPNTIRVPNPYSGEYEDEAGFHELDRHFTMSPFTDTFLWGTSQEEDPWPDVFPAQPAYMPKIVNQSRTVRKQKEGGICRFTRRTRFSRSEVSIEFHHKKLYVWEARYRPSPHARWVRTFNEGHGTSFPEDMPFDVIGTLFGFDALTAADAEKSVAEQTDANQIVGYLEAITAIRHSDVSVTSLVWQYMQHENESVRRGMAQLCLSFNWESLLEDLALIEPNPAFVTLIGQVLEDGISAPRYDDMGEPVLASRGDDDDDDDESDDDESEDGDE